MSERVESGKSVYPHNKYYAQRASRLTMQPTTEQNAPNYFLTDDADLKAR